MTKQGIDSNMNKLSAINSPRRKRSVASNIVKADPLLNIREGEHVVVTYTSAADKMRVFSAFMREGLESDSAVWYSYPDEESEIVRAKLRENGIDVEKYEREGTLILRSLTGQFMANDRLDYDKAVIDGIKWWAEAKRKGYKHARSIEDVGDFSFVDGQWQKWITDYWLVSKGSVEAVYSPLIMSVTAVNVERMTDKQVDELLAAFGRTTFTPRRFFIDLLENMNSFSRQMGLNHEQLIGRKILLEFNPISNYEKVVENLTNESMANVEPIFVFTSNRSSIHTHLAKQPEIVLFLTSISTSIPKSTSENKVLLPAKNIPLILDALSKVLETNADTNVCFVFDILSELLTSMGLEDTFIFLRHALDMLASEKITCLFLLNTSAHEAGEVSGIRQRFHNLLTYDKDGLEVIKIS